MLYLRAKKLIIFLILIVSFATLSFASEPYTAKVVAVIDGDTLKILTTDKTQVKIRLAEIDCPEKKQPWGQKAKQALSDYVFGKMVEVQPQKKDRYGRVIGHIYIDGLNINREMVRFGHCWVYRKYSKDPSMIDLETDARVNKKGLWGYRLTRLFHRGNFAKLKERRSSPYPPTT